MADRDPEAQHNAQRALERSESNTLAIADLQRELKSAVEELGYLKTFSRRLLGALKAQLKLSDAGLGEMMRHVEESSARISEKPGFLPAPLCSFCERPLQLDSQACIYCGRRSASPNP